MKKETPSRVVFNIFNYAFLALIAVISIYPFLYSLSISLSSAAEAARAGLHLYPKDISFTAFEMVLRNKSIYTGYMNTIFRTVVGTALSIIMTSLAAYPLSRNYCPGKKFFSMMIIFTMLFSGGLIPSYLLMSNLHLLNTRLVYVLPGMISAFNMIVIKNFFQSLPESLPEAARIDGASELRILFRIVMPLSKPVLATVTLWVAVGHWNAWFDAMIYINSESKQVLQTFLQRIVIENSTQLIEQGLVNPDLLDYTPETIKAATIMITILPILCLYPFLQKYFAKGIMLGSVKG